MPFVLPHAPELTEDGVRALVERVVPGGSAVHVTITPARFAQVKGCFPAVQEKIRRDGGAMTVGWQIWRTSFLLEAEYHAVWCALDGSLHDITPKGLPIDRILFVADPARTYDGAWQDNVRMNMSGNALGNDFIAIAEALFAVENRGERAYQADIELSQKEAGARDFLLGQKHNVEIMIAKGLTEDSPCFCRSGATFRACHAVSISQAIAICHDVST